VADMFCGGAFCGAKLRVTRRMRPMFVDWLLEDVWPAAGIMTTTQASICV
jgi:hypothetical protein